MGRLGAALDEQLEAMTTGQEHRGLVEACRALADVVDTLEVFDDRVWREYRLLLTELRRAVGDVSGADPLVEAVEAMRTAARDAEKSGA